MMFFTKFILFLFLYVVDAKIFQFLNMLDKEIWIGCQGDQGYPALNFGGWKLAPEEKTSVYSEDVWMGHFWARTGCDPVTNHCETGDCQGKLKCNGTKGLNPNTQAEFILQGPGTLDMYQITVMHGFNLKISVEPLGGHSDGSQYSCKSTHCSYNILADCPLELQIKNKTRAVIGCRSACKTFITEQYCCYNEYNTTETCLPTEWPVNYAKYFKDRCPEANTYAHEEPKFIFTCDAPTYLIIFYP